MKKAVVSMALLLAMITGHAQQTVTKDKQGNYVATPSTTATKEEGYTATGKKFTDKSGVVYDVYQSARGKLFVFRISRKTGNKYKYYLTVQN